MSKADSLLADDFVHNDVIWGKQQLVAGPKVHCKLRGSCIYSMQKRHFQRFLICMENEHVALSCRPSSALCQTCGRRIRTFRCGLRRSACVAPRACSCSGKVRAFAPPHRLQPLTV